MVIYVTLGDTRSTSRLKFRSLLPLAYNQGGYEDCL
jgi:hypothetical protein